MICFLPVRFRIDPILDPRKSVIERPSGKLVDVISTSDLKHVLSTEDRWENMWKSVGEFKTEVRKSDANITAAPVCVTTTDTFADVLRLMREHHIHRVFVVTTMVEMIPLDVVTMTDCIRFICDKTRSKAQWNAWW